MNYYDITDAICDETIARSNFYKELSVFVENKDKLSFINKIIEKYNCDFDNALIVAEYFIDKKQLPSDLTPQQIAHNNQVAREWSNKPKCQICGSTNIKKISGVSKAGSVALFGVFAVGKVSKQWKCSNCGSEF